MTYGLDTVQTMEEPVNNSMQHLTKRKWQQLHENQTHNENIAKNKQINTTRILHGLRSSSRANSGPLQTTSMPSTGKYHGETLEAMQTNESYRTNMLTTLHFEILVVQTLLPTVFQIFV